MCEYNNENIFLKHVENNKTVIKYTEVSGKSSNLTNI